MTGYCPRRPKSTTFDLFKTSFTLVAWNESSREIVQMMSPGLFGVGDAVAVSVLFTASARMRTTGLFVESLEVFSVCLVSSRTTMAFATAAPLMRRPGSSGVSSAASARWTKSRLSSAGAAQVMWPRTSRALRKYDTARMTLGICICEFWPKLCFVNASYLDLGRWKPKEEIVSSNQPKPTDVASEAYIFARAASGIELSWALQFFGNMTTHPCAVAYGWRREAAGCRPQRLPWNSSPRILRVLDPSAPPSVSATKSGPNTACVVIFRSVNQPWDQLKSHNHKLIHLSRVGREDPSAPRITPCMIAHSTDDFRQRATTASW